MKSFIIEFKIFFIFFFLFYTDSSLFRWRLSAGVGAVYPLLPHPLHHEVARHRPGIRSVCRGSSYHYFKSQCCKSGVLGPDIWNIPMNFPYILQDFFSVLRIRIDCIRIQVNIYITKLIFKSKKKLQKFSSLNLNLRD